MALQYLTSCVELTTRDLDALHGMVDCGRQVSYRTARDHIGRDVLASVFPDYKWTRTPGGLSMRHDWHVGYFRSVFRGRPVYYVVHSAIEYIFGEV